MIFCYFYFLSLILKKQAQHKLAKSIIFSVAASCSFRYWTHRSWTPAKRKQKAAVSPAARHLRVELALMPADQVRRGPAIL